VVDKTPIGGFNFFVLIYCKNIFSHCVILTHTQVCIYLLCISILLILVLISLSEVPSSGMAKNGYFYQEMGE